MRDFFKLLVIAILLILVDISIHEIYRSRYEDVSHDDNYISDQIKYEVFSRDMQDRILGYLSGDWRSSTGSLIRIELVTEPQTITIGDEKFNIVSVDKVDSVFGVVRFTARNSRYLANQKFQINKVFDTAGLIILIVDAETEMCKEIKKIDPLAPICAKALYWREKDEK